MLGLRFLVHFKTLFIILTQAIAKALGGVLNSRKDLRNIVFTTLRKLVTFAFNSKNEEDLATMAKYAKNYLPIFFTVYTSKAKGTDEEGSRLAAYETIKVTFYFNLVYSNHIIESKQRNTILKRKPIGNGISCKGGLLSK